MERTQQPALIYAGIGARATPDPVLAHMTKIANSLAQTGWHLTSGGANGADTAFALGAPAGRKTIYLPWPKYNGNVHSDCYTLSPQELSACIDIASRMHPAWDRCSQGVRKLHARNVAILLGPSLAKPVNALVCWTEAGEVIGGTGMALRIAAEYRIPVMNLATISPLEALTDLEAIGLG